MDNKKFKKLINRYLDGTATNEEFKLVDKFLDTFNEENFIWQPNIMGDSEDINKEILQKIQEKTKAKNQDKLRFANNKNQKNKFNFYLRVAASILILITLGYYLFRPLTEVEKISPGTDKAYLTLADGEVIVLDDVRDGDLTSQGTTVISKSDNKLVYDACDSTLEPNYKVLYNKVSTPRGGQYHLVLPDGSNVWLNASSSIKFPTVFSGYERRVEITGEVYFEVKTQPNSKTKGNIPFFVIANDMEIKVLGTHFNVNSYKDDNTLKATLVEGSIVVSSIKNGRSMHIVPGQQAKMLENGNITINEVNISEIIAWKNGMFYYNDTGIETIMNGIARWYDVDVVYKGDVQELKFGGILSRKEDIESLLKLISLTGVVQFDIKDRTVIVKPKNN
jgi:ferric-dicitrate binding protein FerR (iron transport regulator)